MARRLVEMPALEEREPVTIPDGPAESVTKVFRVSHATYLAFEQALESTAAVTAMPPTVYGFPAISVCALEENGVWNGWSWLHDECFAAGLDPAELGL